MAEINIIIKILSVGWFACLLVQAWRTLLWKTVHLKSMKPFSCQQCMGFWMGFIFFFNEPLIDLFILSCMTSLAAVTLHHVSNIIAQNNKLL